MAMTAQQYPLRGTMPLTGPTRVVSVGNVTHAVPALSAVRWSRNRALCYVAFEGKLYVLTVHGEIEIPDKLRRDLMAMHFRGAYK